MPASFAAIAASNFSTSSGVTSTFPTTSSSTYLLALNKLKPFTSFVASSFNKTTSPLRSITVFTIFSVAS